MPRAREPTHHAIRVGAAGTGRHGAARQQEHQREDRTGQAAGRRGQAADHQSRRTGASGMPRRARSAAGSTSQDGQMPLASAAA